MTIDLFRHLLVLELISGDLYVKFGPFEMAWTKVHGFVWG
jgi:hypothetical protein